MKKIIFLKLLSPILLLWFLATLDGIAQAPAADIDSITEDSYQRMLARQKAEQELDSLRIHQLDLVLSEADVKQQKRLQYLMLAFMIIGFGFLFWYLCRNSLKNKSP